MRNVGSGSQGRKDKSRSDSVHPSLFLSSKATEEDTALWKLWRRFASTLREGTSYFPVVELTCKGQVLYITHSGFIDRVLGVDPPFPVFAVDVSRSATHSLFREEQAKADVESKVVVLCMHKLRCRGFLIVFAMNDFPRIKAAWSEVKI